MTAALAAPYPSWSVHLTSRSLSASGSGSPQSVEYTIANDGAVKDIAFATLETWLSGGTNSDWEIRGTVQSGDTPDGSPLGSWINAVSNVTWSLTDSTAGDGPTSCVLLVEIRRVGSGVAATSATITLSATRIA